MANDNTKSLKQLLDEKQNKLTAGANITIDENNIISATGGGNNSFIIGATAKMLQVEEFGHVIFGLENLVIDKTIAEVLLAYNQNKQISCKLILTDEDDRSAGQVVLNLDRLTLSEDSIAFLCLSTVAELGSSGPVHCIIAYDARAEEQWYGYFIGLVTALDGDIGKVCFEYIDCNTALGNRYFFKNIPSTLHEIIIKVDNKYYSYRAIANLTTAKNLADETDIIGITEYNIGGSDDYQYLILEDSARQPITSNIQVWYTYLLDSPFMSNK